MHADRLDELSHAENPRALLLWHACPEPLLQLGEQLDALHGVEPQIQFQVRVRPRDRTITSCALDHGQDRRNLRTCGPLPIRVAHSGVGALRTRIRGLLHAALDLESFELSGARPRQRLHGHFVPKHPLWRRETHGEAFHLEPDEVACVYNLLFAERIGVGHDDRV